MRIIKCNNYEELSQKAADFVAAQIILKPNCVLGLPTGSTPIGMYERLTSMGLDFSEVTTFNLDEYYPIQRTNEQSYYYFMNKHLYSKVNLCQDNIFIPNGSAANAEQECLNYEKAIKEHGGLDMQVLGIGQNGHIGFNEPGGAFELGTHCVDLTESTIEANARFFDCREEVPRQAYTMGIRTIMQARKVLMIASGEKKKKIIKEAFFGAVTPAVPASILQMHPDFTLIGDAGALAEIDL